VDQIEKRAEIRRGNANNTRCEGLDHPRGRRDVRFFLRKVFHRPISVGPEKFVGQIAETLTPLNPSGQIKANGAIWTAISHAGAMIPAQWEVKILDVLGTTVHVEPVL